MRTEVLITHTMDSDGRPLVFVPLTNVEKSVILYQDDFNGLFEAGLDPRWRLSQGTVFERGRSGVAIARLVCNAKAGDKVQYLDGNPCNLKRTNLVKTVGNAKSTTMDKLSPVNRPHKFNDTVFLKHIYNNPSWVTKDLII